ncbi:cell division protein FtsB [Noviluteimonas dokdonensis]|uniref:cell division protein FtsB n=1 Tax=Noviluteimonas dokdonensis TaxID=414050 RepID=UPI0030840C04
MIAALIVLLLALLAWLQYKLWFGQGGAGQVQALSTQVEHQARDNTGLRQRNAEVAAEVEDLKSGEAAVEERARSELGMIKPGESFYRVVEPASQSTAAAPPAADEDGE